MSIFTWGAQPKSQVDPETIEEAITRIVAQHEHDPTSHLGENESIEAHRTSEVIDHLASSVYDDKLAYDRNTYDIVFSNLALFDKSAGVENNGLFNAYLYSANSSSSQWIYGFEGDMNVASFWSYEKNPRFMTKIMVTNITSQIGYILVGYRDEYLGYGFKIANNKLYGMYYKLDHSEHTLELLTLASATPYKLECRVKSLTLIEFYVNNALAGSISNAVLTSSVSYGLNLPWIDWKSTTTTARELFIDGIHFEADL